MTATFAARAAALWPMAARRLGWTPDTFWAATPAELAGALVPAGEAGPMPLSRGEMQRMMETEHDSER